jgi:hypothetical protein
MATGHAVSPEQSASVSIARSSLSIAGSEHRFTRAMCRSGRRFFRLRASA